MKKILVIGLGGTIGSVRGETISLDDNNLKIVAQCQREDVTFECCSPFSVLSENMSIALWKQLLSYLERIDFSDYAGVILLHGSDTLAYTAAIVANAFPRESIILTAADKPIEDNGSNGIANFNQAVDTLLREPPRRVLVSYNGLHKADCITGADIHDAFLSLDSTLPPLGVTKITDKNILIVNSYVGLDSKNYNLDNVDGVLIHMYHSATVPESAKTFAAVVRGRDIPCYFVTHKHRAEYETAQGIDNIIFSCTIENAYARLLLRD